jgi:nitroreductase
MKIKFTLLIIALVAITNIYGQNTGNSVIDLLQSIHSSEKYTSEPVTDQQLDLILKSGIKAPSAVNGQPWKFTVIKDEATVKSVINDAMPGNVLIVVSGVESETGTTPDFDCGLAAQNMFIAAHSLGLAARPYGSPTRIINRTRERFQIPTGYKAVIVLRIGNIDKSVDTVSSASPRKAAEEVINYMTP